MPASRDRAKTSHNVRRAPHGCVAALDPPDCRRRTCSRRSSAALARYQSTVLLRASLESGSQEASGPQNSSMAVTLGQCQTRAQAALSVWCRTFHPARGRTESPTMLLRQREASQRASTREGSLTVVKEFAFCGFTARATPQPDRFETRARPEARPRALQPQLGRRWRRRVLPGLWARSRKAATRRTVTPRD